VDKRKKLRIFDLQKPDSDPTTFSGSGVITYLGIVPDSNLILGSAQEEKSISVWDKRTQKVVKELETAAPVSIFQVSVDGTTVVGAAGQSVYFWDAKSLNLIKSIKLSRKIDAVSYHPSAKFFVTGSAELWARAYDFTSGDEIAVNKGHHGPVRCLAFNPSGDAYASGSEDGTIRIWEWQKEKQQKEKEKEKEGAEIEVESSKTTASA